MFLAGTLALQAAMVAENDRLNRAAMENERLRQEVEIGSVIQQTLLLGIPPEGMRAFRLATLAVPSKRWSTATSTTSSAWTTARSTWWSAT